MKLHIHSNACCTSIFYAPVIYFRNLLPTFIWVTWRDFLKLVFYRYHSITPIARAHRATTNSQLGSYAIPKDTDVLINFYSLHHDPKLWNNPEEFRPERFLTSDGRLLAPGEGARANECAFGAGPRTCVARVFGYALLFMLFGITSQHFTVKPHTTVEEQVSCHPSTYLSGLLTCPQPYKVRMVPRHSMWRCHLFFKSLVDMVIKTHYC